MPTLITIITGAINSGKTSEAKNYINTKGEFYSCAGILAQGIYEKGFCSHKSGYAVRSIRTGDQRILMSSVSDEANVPVGRFFLYPEAMDWAKGQLQEGMRAEILVVDELGPLELAEKGYYDTVKSLVADYRGELVLVMRDSVIEALCSKLCIKMDMAKVLTPKGVDL